MVSPSSKVKRESRNRNMFQKYSPRSDLIIRSRRISTKRCLDSKVGLHYRIEFIESDNELNAQAAINTPPDWPCCGEYDPRRRFKTRPRYPIEADPDQLRRESKYRRSGRAHRPRYGTYKHKHEHYRQVEDYE